jgi:ribose transport system ATP-binding protein
MAAQRRVADLTKRSLVSLMLGKDVEPNYRIDLPDPSDQAIGFEAENIYGRYLRGVGLQLRKGEIVGLAGLPGSGGEELGYIVGGQGEKGVEGRVRIPTKNDSWVSVDEASRENIALVPADRTTEGLIGEMSVGENLSLSVLDRVSRHGLLSPKAERDMVRRLTDDLEVRANRPSDPISTLSGGNQQKVLIGRCLASLPGVLVLNQPTAGVDVGARRAIYDLIGQQARDGLTVLIWSSDIEDMLAVCHRIIVFRGGVVSDVLEGEGLTEGAVIHAMEGTNGKEELWQTTR